MGVDQGVRAFLDPNGAAKMRSAEACGCGAQKGAGADAEVQA